MKRAAKSAAASECERLAAEIDAHVRRVNAKIQPLLKAMQTPAAIRRAELIDRTWRTLSAGLMSQDPNERALYARIFASIARKTHRDLLKPIPPKKKPGPKRYDDAKLLAEMAQLLQSGKVNSVRAAAVAVAPRAKGGNTELDSKIARLRKTFAALRRVGEI